MSWLRFTMSQRIAIADRNSAFTPKKAKAPKPIPKKKESKNV